MRKLLWFLIMVLFSSGVTAVSTIREVNPAFGSWQNTSAVTFNFTIEGSDAGYNCTFLHNFNGTWSNNDTVSITNASTIVNFTEGLPENNTGMLWNVFCMNNETGVFQGPNSSGGNITYVDSSQNRTIYMDSTAPSLIVLDLPINNSYSPNQTPLIQFTVGNEANHENYTIQFSNTTNFAVTDISRTYVITTDYTNVTKVNYTITSSLEPDKKYYWRILNRDKAGNTRPSNISIYTTDNTLPVFNASPKSPANGTYSSITLNQNFSFAVLETNVGSCWINITNATGGNYTTNVTVSYTNNTQIDIPLNLSETNGTGYQWNIFCNDSVNNNVTLFSYSNRTLFVDRTPPTAPSCVGPANASTTTDWTPSFDWLTSNELNFDHYSLYVGFNKTLFSFNFSVNITNISSSNHTVNFRSQATNDTTWYWYVNVTDKAGHIITGGNCSSDNGTFIYTTDVTAHLLKSGWNMYSIVRGGIVNASDLATETDAQIVSYWNSSKEFQTFTNGSTVNALMNFTQGDVVFIYVGGDVYWENRTWNSELNLTNIELVNLTNSSGSSNASQGWNTYGELNRTGHTLQNIDFQIRNSNYDLQNISNDVLNYIVYYNSTQTNNTQKYITMVYGINWNNGTRIDYGESVWININASGTPVGQYTFNRSAPVNES